MVLIIVHVLLFDFVYSLELKRRYFVEIFQFSILYSYSGSQWGPVLFGSQNI